MMDTYEYYYDFGEDDFNSDDVMDYYDSDGNLIFDEDQLNDLMQRSTPGENFNACIFKDGRQKRSAEDFLQSSWQ